jgi:hypothetical protein
LTNVLYRARMASGRMKTEFWLLGVKPAVKPIRQLGEYMGQKAQLLTKSFMRFLHVWWFGGLMLSVLLTPGCGGAPVEPKPVEEASPAKMQEEIPKAEVPSEQIHAEPEFNTDEAARSLLVLYKSSEGDTAKGNIFVYHLQAFALSQKYNLMYHDIDESFPSDATMKDIQAIVTVFDGPIMKKAKEYIEWLSRQARENKKVVIIGNFGAFSPDGNEWYDPTILNTFYHTMGLEFAGHWTNNPKVIRIVHKDEDMIGDITPTMLTHYFLIKSVNPDNVIYLSLRRTDLDDSESAVVVKTPAGCLAMENYVFTQVANQTKKLLNLERFFTECMQ